MQQLVYDEMVLRWTRERERGCDGEKGGGDAMDAMRKEGGEVEQRQFQERYG